MKRSAQVALLLMGVGGVGAGAYAVSPPRNNCVAQGAATPSAVAPNPAGPVSPAKPCPPRRSGYSGGYSSGGRYGSWSSWSSPTYSRGSTAAGGTRTSSGGGVARGGFGSTGHSASAHS
jgi:hypothetical protein